MFGNEQLHDARVADNAVDLAARHRPERFIARRVVHQLRARVVLLQELLLPDGRFGGTNAFEHVIVVVAGVSDHDAVLNERRGLVEVFLFARPRVVIHGEDHVDLVVLDGLAHRIAAIERLRFDGNAQIFFHDGKRRSQHAGRFSLVIVARDGQVVRKVPERDRPLLFEPGVFVLGERGGHAAVGIVFLPVLRQEVRIVRQQILLCLIKLGQQIAAVLVHREVERIAIEPHIRR